MTYSSPLAAYIAPSGTMKAGHQRSFLISTNFIFVSCDQSVCCLGQCASPSSSDRQPGVMVKNYIHLKVLHDMAPDGSIRLYFLVFVYALWSEIYSCFLINKIIIVPSLCSIMSIVLYNANFHTVFFLDIQILWIHQIKVNLQSSLKSSLITQFV